MFMRWILVALFKYVFRRNYSSISLSRNIPENGRLKREIVIIVYTDDELEMK